MYRHGKMKLLTLLLLFCVAAVYHLSATGHVEDTSTPCAVTVILVGSTGDLAKRYIWPAIFDNYYARLKESRDECSLVVYGASRNPVTDEDELWSAVSINVRCSDDTDGECEDSISELRKVTHFVQLRNEEHYSKLAEIVTKHYEERRATESGRIFYLSVPPSAYADISKYVHVHGRPNSGWLRVVFEKPFGQDLSSAQSLAQELSKYLKEEEIYRIDHYLGKLGVQQIMPFRQRNFKKLFPFWNKEFIDRIDIVMKERLDVKGRSAFFNKYGVIRDVLQNHLTEILFLTVADFDTEGSLKEKTKFLAKIYSPRVHHAILGQYFDYQQHLLEDGVLKNLGNFSNVPTYASVALYMRDSKWRGVPFILTSGKQLEKRASYIEVTFKEGLNDPSLDPKEECDAKVVFLIQDEELGRPGILLSAHFSHFDLRAPFPRWTEKIVPYPDSQSDCRYTFLHPELPVSSNAYISLLKAILGGVKDLFVDTESLMESWRIWTPLLEESELAKPALKIYAPNSLDILDFRIKNTQLVSAHTSIAVPQENAHALKYATTNSAALTEMFHLPAYISNRFELASLLAEHICLAALKSVKERGSFHIALPGGTSPRLLLQTLALEYANNFPWDATHIWQTDERCVKVNESDSNIRLLSDYLLTSVPVPRHHVHSMLTESHTGVCSEEEHPETAYEEQLQLHLPGSRLDYVLLGVGSDGHIASLFPEMAVSEQHGKLVAKVTLIPGYSIRVSERLSLTYETILSAKSISVLMLGKGKVEMFHTLKDCLQEPVLEEHCEQLPVAKLIKLVGLQQATLFIDSLFLDSV